MRFFCRDTHDERPERCPPHRFEGGWQNSSDAAPGILWCRWCGDIRELIPPTIGPIDDETPLYTSAEDGSGSRG